MALAATTFSVPAPLMCEPQDEEALLEEVVEGLRQDPKRVSPIRLRDERGAALYDRLCGAPEYYLARSELALIDAYAEHIARGIGSSAVLIEIGRGAGLKARVLLDEMESPSAYVPVEVARTPLIAAARTLAVRFPDISVLPVCADFTRAFIMPEAIQEVDRRVVYLSGAALGHFTRDEAVDLLRMMHLLVGSGGAVLVSIDLEKDPQVVERAYNDSAGVGAELNRNVLRTLNHRFDADFDLRRYLHRAVWVEDESRVELGLVSECDQAVNVGGTGIEFAEDEQLLTGYDHKHSPEGFAAMAEDAGLGIREAWTDEQWRFSVQLLEPAGEEAARAERYDGEAPLIVSGRLGNAPAF